MSFGTSSTKGRRIVIPRMVFQADETGMRASIPHLVDKVLQHNPGITTGPGNAVSLPLIVDVPVQLWRAGIENPPLFQGCPVPREISLQGRCPGTWTTNMDKEGFFHVCTLPCIFFLRINAVPALCPVFSVYVGGSPLHRVPACHRRGSPPGIS